MSSGTIYNESKLSECQAVQFTMKVNFLKSSGTIYNESKLFECQAYNLQCKQFTIYNESKAVQFTMKVNFLNVKRYNLQWK